MKALALILPIAASVALAQQPNGPRYPIRPAAIASLLRADGVNVASSQVHLPMQLTATAPDPHLEIVASRRVTARELDLELHCGAPTECLPFDAVVDVNDASTIVAGAQKGPLGKSEPEAGVEHVAQQSTPTTQSAGLTSDRVRAGASAVLIMVDSRMRIHLPVIAMDSGSKGTLIRVCTLDRKRIFRAVVVNDATVQGAVQ